MKDNTCQSVPIITLESLRSFLQKQNIIVDTETVSQAKRVEESRWLSKAALDAAAARKVEEAISFARQAIGHTPMWVEPYYHLGRFLHLAGDNTAAVDTLEICTHLHPYFDPAYDSLAELYLSIGNRTKALEISQRLEHYVPSLADNRFRLGTIYLRAGLFTEACKWFDLGLNSLIPSCTSRSLSYGVVTIPRLRHDIAQMEWMLRQKLLPDSYQEVIVAYKHALSTAPCSEKPRSWAEPLEWRLERESLTALAPFYRRCLHLANANRVERAINPKLKFDAIEKAYLSESLPDKAVVIDDLLTREALGLLWRYCLESTIWHNDAQKGRNYVGAYMRNGFHCPLLDQIADELRDALPNVIGNTELSQVWAYKHVMGQTAIGTHADFALINVNFWLTPDCANLNRGTGGLLIFKKEAPEDWNFEDYNNNDKKILQEVIDAEVIHVQYRQNRAVLFDSRLFHSSDCVDFGTSYEDMRINVTLLYGNRTTG